jgi:hypothetical protein
LRLCAFAGEIFFLPYFVQSRSYSYLSATSGLTFVARRAGR